MSSSHASCSKDSSPNHDKDDTCDKHRKESPVEHNDSPAKRQRVRHYLESFDDVIVKDKCPFCKTELSETAVCVYHLFIYLLIYLFLVCIASY